ncbi:MAG: 5-dehydro-4-deoxy-D-glucuronate isomerase [Clostridiaceae bacterium]|nr:5-dehydro-4-deoxy-D-glucuronate isomerase [Clostridiaceae bacterium]
MDIRYSTGPEDIKRYTTEELRSEFLVNDLYKANEVVTVYSHIDRAVVLGIMPTNEDVPIDRGLDVWKNFGTKFFLQRREAGFFNIGGAGTCIVDGIKYEMANKDCIYITQGTENVVFASLDAADPAKFYGVSYPAHCSYETKFISINEAAKKPLGEQKAANKRVINQFIHPSVLRTCQLSMGLTILEQGSVWNTMPVHTHERRMEVYTYFDIEGDNVVFHLMGQPDQTRHIVVQNEEAVLSPSYSIHAGCGTGSYAFIWAMGGENQEFDDMDAVNTRDIR